MPPVYTTVVVPTFEGVTTAIVVFVFACVILPHLVKNKTQFYAAFAMVMVVILLHSLAIMIGTAGFQVFAGAVSGLLQVGAIVLLFLACGGVTMKQLGGDLARAYEVIRRGEEEKTIIVPLTGEQPKSRADRATAASPDLAASIRDEEAALDRAESEVVRPPPVATPPPHRRDDSSLPLE
jgi:hypothetical protein